MIQLHYYLFCRTVLDTFFNLHFHSLYNFNESEVIIGNVTDSSLYHLILTSLIYAAKITAIVKYQTKVAHNDQYRYCNKYYSNI